MADGEPTFPGSDSLGPRVDAFLHTLEMNEEVTLVRAPLSTIEPKRPDTDAARKEGSLLDAAPRSSRVRLESLLLNASPTLSLIHISEPTRPY